MDDKLRCKALLSAHGISVPATYYVVSTPKDLEGWPKAVADVDKFVIKPNSGYGGNGVAPVVKRNDLMFIGDRQIDSDDVEFHLLQIMNGGFSRDNMVDSAFLEHFVEYDGVLGDLVPHDVDGIPDIRIIYLHSRPLMAMLRLPSRESGGRANLHQGGIGVGIDMDAGVTSDGCYRNRIIHRHPETGVSLHGRTVPSFEEMRELGTRIAGIVGLGYIGVDFVIDAASGPMVLEVNARPGLNIQIANATGLRGEFL